MRRFRRHNRFSTRDLGLYGRDKARGKRSKRRKGSNPWADFIEANKHLSQFRKRNGQLNLKKLGAAYRKKKAGRKGSSGGSKKFDQTPAFRQRLGGLRSLVNSIAGRPRKKSSGPKKARKYGPSQKLRMVEAEMKRLEHALQRAKERAKTAAEKAARSKEAKKAKKAARRAGSAAKEAEQLAHAIISGKASAIPAREESLRRKIAEVYKQAGEAKAAAFASQSSRGEKEKQASLFPFASNLINRDPRRRGNKKKASKKRPKKRASAKRPKKRSAKRGMSASHKRKIAAGRKKMTAWKKKEGKKRAYAKLSPKARTKKLNRAWAAYRKRTGRDADGSALDFARDFLGF